MGVRLEAIGKRADKKTDSKRERRFQRHQIQSYKANVKDPSGADISKGRVNETREKKYCGWGIEAKVAGEREPSTGWSWYQYLIPHFLHTHYLPVVLSFTLSLSLFYSVSQDRRAIESQGHI